MALGIFYSILITIFLSASAYTSAASTPIEWLDEQWQYRQIIIKGPVSPELKLEYGNAEIDTEGHVQPDGADIRVTDIWNTVAPYRVESVSPEGLVRVEFELYEGPDETAYFVYYGNPDAEPLNYELKGLHLTLKENEGSQVKRSSSVSVSFEVTARQRISQTVNTYFKYSIENKQRLIGTEVVLTEVRFTNLSTDLLEERVEPPAPSDTSATGREVQSGSGPAVPLKCTWDFGDGQSTTERNPVHTYKNTGSFPVSLTTENSMGFEDTYSIVIDIDRTEAEKTEITWDLQEDVRLIDPDQEEIEVRLCYHMYGSSGKKLLLESTITSHGEIIQENRETLELLPRDPISSNIKLPNREGSFAVTWSLSFKGTELFRKGLKVIEDTDRFPRVSASDASMVDSDGRHVIVKLTGEANTVKRRLADIFEPGEVRDLRIAVIDNSLCSSDEVFDETGLYYTELKTRLEREYPGVTADIRRFASKIDELGGYFPIRRLVGASAEIYDLDPDAIIICCDQRDLSSFTQPEDLGRYYALMIHNFIANTRAKIILVTPPPWPERTRAHRSKIFAAAISKLGLIHNVGLANVYQAVSLYGADWRELFRDEEQTDNVFHLYMNPEGQDIIAETLFKAIIQD